MSNKPFGRWTRKGGFKFEIDKVPFYNVPDLTNFKLKPYVPHITPKISEDNYVNRVISIDEELLEKINM